MQIDTPQYISALLQPTQKKAPTRKVWSIDLEFVWLPFFTSTNVEGNTTIPRDALGAPLRLAKAKDGSVKFAQNGRPVLKVASELSNQIRMVRDNFTGILLNHASEVQKAQPDEYAEEVEACQQAGEPIRQAIQTDVVEAITLRQPKEKAEEEAPTSTRELVGAAA